MKNSKVPLIIFAGIIAVIFLAIGIASVFSKKSPADPPAPPTPTAEPDPEQPTSPNEKPVDYPDENFTFTDEMGDVVLSHNNYFYSENIKLKIYTRKDATVRYTMNGEKPTAKSTKYDPKFGIDMNVSTDDDPKAYTVHAIAFYEDGTQSDEIIHTYLLGRNVDTRFENLLIFCISGEPADLTASPNGIFFGLNYEQRGRASERPVYVEVLNRAGEKITEQRLGVRINGAYNRQNSQKSMKFFARKSYSPEAGTTYLNCFNLLAEDGTQIVRFDKFVLRASGNDFRFAFVRDELNQMLAKDAGFEDYEPVFPAIAYMNGQYFGFYWLHGAYCDEFFKDRYGDSPAKKAANGGEYVEGEFVILAGKDTKKDLDADDETASKIAEEFNRIYDSFASKNLTNNANYNELRKWMDVENYLDYMAYNIYLCNKDWPDNNVRCYRYFAAEGESYGEGPYDGRWRYLLHDIDYTLGLYGQQEVMNSYDTLKQVLTGTTERRSPLFAALMERADCREYFIKKSLDFGSGALSYQCIAARLNSITKNRENEMHYYYKYLTSLGKQDVSWINEGQLDDNLDSILKFALRRADRAADYLKFDLGLTGVKYNLNITGVAGARIVVNSFTAKDGNNVNGIYFTDFATAVSAEYSLGKAFDYWEVNGKQVRTQKLSITKNDLSGGAVNIVLHIKDAPMQQIYISEYSARNTDSVTITNLTAADVDLSGYVLTDGTYEYPFADGDVIKVGESIVVYGNNAAADASSVRKAVFNLSEDETIVLKDKAGKTIDSFTIPKTHNGFVFKRNVYTKQFEELRP